MLATSTSVAKLFSDIHLAVIIQSYFCRDLNARFSEIFMPMIFMEGEGDEIKSKQASKRDRTLLKQI